MSPPNAAKPALELTENGHRRIDQVGRQITREHTKEADPPQPLIDKYGHRHTAAVLRHWSPAILKAMGVHYIEPIRRRPELPRRRI